MLKHRGVKCYTRKSSRQVFAYGQNDPIETLSTFAAKICCEASEKECFDEFIIIKGSGSTQLGKRTAETLNLLKVGPFAYMVKT